MTAISIAGTAGCQTGNYWRYTPTGAKGPRSINAKMMPRSIVTCLPLVFYEEATQRMGASGVTHGESPDGRHGRSPP
jgi:hypothetical protein